MFKTFLPEEGLLPLSFTHRPGTASKSLIGGHSSWLVLEVTALYPWEEGLSEGWELLLLTVGLLFFFFFR